MPHHGQDSGYWALCRDGIQRAARDLAVYGVSIRIDEFDRHDAESYQKLLADLAADPGDGFAIAPVAPSILVPALKRLSRKVPYVFFDGSIEGAEPLCSVGQDAFSGGFLAARILDMASPDAGPLIAVVTHREDRHIRLRMEGFAAYCRGDASPAARRASLDRSPAGTPRRTAIVRECYDLEDPSIRGAFFERLFEEHPHASGILVTNASGHHAGKWLAERCLKEKHAVVCWDLVPSNVEALIAGEVDCILSQKPADQARYAMDRLFKAIVRNDRSGAEELVMPLEIYFRENLPAARPSDNPRSEEYDEREFA
jgi:LacI family transcriptional regulator